jgi:hypothetical protein
LLPWAQACQIPKPGTSKTLKIQRRTRPLKIVDIPYDGVNNLFEPDSESKPQQGWPVDSTAGRNLAVCGILGSKETNGVGTEQTTPVWRDEQTGDEQWHSLVVKDGNKYQIYWYFVDYGPRLCGNIDEHDKCPLWKAGFMDVVPMGFEAGKG